MLHYKVNGKVDNNTRYILQFNRRSVTSAIDSVDCCDHLKLIDKMFISMTI